MRSHVGIHSFIGLRNCANRKLSKSERPVLSPSLVCNVLLGMTEAVMATTLPSSAEGMVDRLTPNVPMLILLAHLFDGDGEGFCAEPCGNREAQWPSLWQRRKRAACGRAASQAAKSLATA